VTPVGASTPLRCLSLQQPHAWAICVGAKTVENRSWGTEYRGLVAIHAGARRQRVNELVRKVGRRCAGLFTLGAIIGVAELVDVVEMNESLESNPSAYGPVCWILRNALLLPSPITTRGRLQLYTLAGPESEQVRRQLPGLRNPPISPDGQECIAAMRLDPVRQCIQRAYVYADMQRPSDTIRCCDEAIRLDPACSHAFHVRGSAKVYLTKDYRGGISDCDEAIRGDPDDAQAYKIRSDGHRALGNETQADAD